MLIRQGLSKMLGVSGGVSTSIAARAAITAQRNLDNEISRVSSGYRINSAKDDAAGVAISNRLDSHVYGLAQANKNALDAQSLVKIADKSLSNIEGQLQRIRELAVQGASDTMSEPGRKAMKLEIDELLTEIQRVVDNTSWAGEKLLDGTFRNRYGYIGASAGVHEALRIDIDGVNLSDFITVASDFVNGDFSDTVTTTNGTKTTFKGWEITAEQVVLGTTAIAGFTTPTDSTPTPSSASGTSPGDGSTPSPATYNHELDGNSARLRSTSMTTANPGDVVRGPYIVSQEGVNIAKDREVSFKWKAENGADAYDIFAYLVDENTGHTVELLNKTGSVGDTEWESVSAKVDKDGKYKFVFVSGTFDYTFGRQAGASLYITDVVADGYQDTSTTADIFKYLNVDTHQRASSSIDSMDRALASLAKKRAALGSLINRLDSAVESNTNTHMNVAKSSGVMKDLDFSEATMDMARYQILSNSSTSMIAQANASIFDVLTLIN